jgi:hypothetical protein
MHNNGWDLDLTAKTLTLFGPPCDQLQSATSSVQVGYTCPPPG